MINKINTILKICVKLLLILLVTLAINASKAWSYQMAANDNAGSIHTDKPFYVVGEVIWFKVYLPDRLQYRRSLARIDLISRRKEILHTQHISVDKQNNGQGYYLIPYDFKPDIYFLTVTVFNEDGNYPLTLVYHPVAIYNDLHPMDTTLIDFERPMIPASETAVSKPNASINISSDKSIYRPREAVSLKIRVTDPKGEAVQGNLSVSVTDKDLIDGHPKNISNFSKGPDVTQSFLVDNQIAVRGMVKHTVDKQVYESDYLAAVMGEEGLMIPFESYDDGTFEIDLPYFDGKRQMQLVAYLTNDIFTTLDQAVSLPANMSEMALTYTKEVLRYLKVSRKRKKINQLFDRLAFQSLPAIQPSENKWEPDRSLDLNHYEPFESMEEFFVQVVTPLKIKKRKDSSYQIRMVNPDNKPFYPGVPRFFIDGRVVDDPVEAVSLDMKSIRRIDLFYFYKNLNRQFDQFGSTSGVVAIYTRDGNYHKDNQTQSNVFQVHGGLPEASFPSIPAAAADAEQNAPIFQPVIYWNPSINTNEQGEAEVKFFHSDDRGTFKVEVVCNCGNGQMVIETSEYKTR
ncbi:hypothetical protein QQ020_34355 [Fulvivirgaceae bacterium BMA12]|uniref:Uncharacterized protein n=1 Tax=Agaribacillus aureus TaxID=3051825 RepID=A0ABT8LL94_9BACT|nr:hypothetical protein [Fulvivirgaceae bacterium BMA12]